MHIAGIDESGKGDFFGPLVIAALVCSSRDEGTLTDMGVRDSKLITDKKALAIADKLKAKFDHSVILIGPEKYNQLYSRIKNLNKLLAWGHARALENVLESSKVDLAISDKFADTRLLEKSLMEKGRELTLQQMVRGERVLQVAAASILARAAFLRHLQSLSGKVGVELLKGASVAVDETGRFLVKKHGPEILAAVAKLHFKNAKRVLA